MKLLKRLKTLGLAAVMTWGMLLPSFSGITASADTMSDTYYTARTGSNKISATEAARSSDGKYENISNGYMEADYQYMIQTTDNTQVTVTVNNVTNTGQSSVDKGAYANNNEYKQYWKLQDSWKGNITATYSHCGYYNGTEIDVKLTLLDWEFLDNNQSRGGTFIDKSDDASNVYVSFPGKNLRKDGTTNRIGVHAFYCSWISVRYSFVKSGTNIPVNVRGYTTFNDIDGCQGVHFVENYRDIITTNAAANLSCAILDDGNPYIFDGTANAGTSSTDSDKKHWITSTFSGTSMTVAFTFGLNYRLNDGNMTSEEKSNWSSLCGNYVAGGSGWIINYNQKAVRSELAEPTKTVSDKDEPYALQNTLSNRNETFTYKISHYAAAEIEENWYYTFTMMDLISADLEVQSVKVLNEADEDVSSSWSINTIDNGSLGTRVVANANAKREDFYNHTYNLIISVKIKDSVDISSLSYKITNTAQITVDGITWYDSNPVTTKVNVTGPSIEKYINTIGTTSYSLHKNSEDITYVGDFYCGSAKQYSSVVITDPLPEGLKYKSFFIVDPSTGSYYTSYGTLNSGGSSNFKFTFNESNLPLIFNKTLRYYLTVTADKTYNGSATENEVIPNTITLTVDGNAVTSNTPKLYRAGVNVPKKSIDKSEISEKTENVTYTISSVVDSRAQEYYYATYAITDTLDDVLEYKSARVLNENGTDVSNSFTISVNGNKITATAKNVTLVGFYGHTYKLEINTNIKKNADLSSYCDDEGVATIPNTGSLIVDGNSYPSNTVDFRYNPITENHADKYVINLSGEKAETTQLDGKTVTYSGSASIQNKQAITSIVLSDKLDKSLRFNDISITLNGGDITDWGNVYYDVSNNTVSFTFNDDRLSNLPGETIEYTINCEYVGEYTEDDIEILNTVTLSVNNKIVESNKPKLYIPGVNTPVKSVDKSEITEKTETVTYTISNVVDSKTKEYFYNSYIITDTLEDVLEYKSAKVLNESGADVSDSFTIAENNNIITATAKDTSADGFYGHTYKLIIQANLIQNADLSGYLQYGKAVIPNTSTLTVNKKNYQSNTVNFSYKPKSIAVDKYIVNSEGEQSDKVELFDETVTYTGNVVIQDKTSVKNIVLSDKLDSNLKYKDISITLDGKDITDWGTASYNEVNNIITFTFKSNKVAELAGKTITYTLTCDFVGQLTNKSVEIPNIMTLVVNSISSSSNEAILTTPVDPSITKYINESDEGYSLHKNSEDITYTGTIIPGTHLKTKLSITDNLEEGLTYKSLKIFSEDGKDITSYGTNSSSGSTVSFVFSEDKTSEIYNTILSYELVVTATKTYDGTATKNEETPNTILLIVEDETVESNTPKLYRSGVNSPVKSVDKSEITEKTETVTYTISSVVDSKTKDYFYNSYVISDTLESVLNIKSTKVLNENGDNVSDLFTIKVDGNTVTATAKNTSTSDFYGHTYSLVIQAGIIDRNTDISNYCDKDGKATIPNTSTLTVDGNTYPSNTVNFTYQTKSNSVDKYILNLNGEKSTETQLYDNVVTYTGKAVIKDKEAVSSIVLSDKLNSNLKLKEMKIFLNDKDITDWGNISYDLASNTVRFSFNKEAFSSVVGETIEYALTCDYIGEYSDKSTDISNIIDLTVNEETEKSNDTTLTIPVDSYITKHIYNGDELVNEYTLSADRKDNKVYYEGSILVSEKEPIKNIVFSDKLDSNLEFVSISFIDGNTDLECNYEYDNGIVKATLSDNAIKDLEGKVIQWKMNCNYVGDEKPTETVTIPNTANVNINKDSYSSNEVNAYVSMVAAYEATQNTTAPTTTPTTSKTPKQVKTSKTPKQVKTTSVTDTAENAEFDSPYTGDNSNLLTLIMTAIVAALGIIIVVCYYKKQKKDIKKDDK